MAKISHQFCEAQCEPTHDVKVSLRLEPLLVRMCFSTSGHADEEYNIRNDRIPLGAKLWDERC